MIVRSARRSIRSRPAGVVAAEWALLQDERELAASEQQRFAEWLAEDEANFTAYEDAIWALDAVARHAGEPQLRELRVAALTARGSQPVRARTWAGGLAVAAAALAGIAVWTIAPRPLASLDGPVYTTVPTAPPRGAVYSTRIGERSAVRLPDDSVVTLDTDSSVRVAYSATERGLYLLKGQALFAVAHGRPLPFRVYARGQRIAAVGTTFNVRIEGHQVRVSMIEGKVQVRSAPLSSPRAQQPVRELTIVAGETLVAEPTGPMVVTSANAAQIASWKGGLLIFHDTPLSGAVAEINRYTTRPIAIADAAVGNYRVSGVFRTNDPEHFAQAMTEVFPIEIVHRPGASATLRLRGD